jgi:hypothetical protein
MHVSTALDAIEKWGTFKAYKEACKTYIEQREVVKQAEAALALLTATVSKGKKTSKKSSKKASEKALQKTKGGAALADVPAPELRAEYQADYEKAKFAAETTKNKCKAAATKMFQFYSNFLSVDAKYAWNKIVKEQMETDPFKDLQGVSRKCPRGLLQESFDDCIMFHLLTVFPNNAAEQEKYYLSNVLKKPQRVGIRQFIQCIEQLNVYVAQLLCWYYSPNYNPGMTLANVPFTKADLASHVLRMCLHQWQGQYNLQEKGMTPITCILFKLLLRLLSACVPRRKPMRNPVRKLLRRVRQEPSGPVLELQSRFPRKSISRSPANCARNMGACIPRMLPRTVAGIRKTEQ